MRKSIVMLLASIVAACTFSKLACATAVPCSLPPTPVTAVVNPRVSYAEQIYVFKGTEYILIELALASPWDDSLVYGPKTIVDDWISLRHVGFTTIDSILPHPTNPNQTYVFSGQRYVLIELPSKPGAGDDVLVYGPGDTFFDWPILQESPAGTYDLTLLSPAPPTNGSYAAYFFRGTEYTSFAFAPNTNDQGIAYSEAHTGRGIDKDWAALKDAGFASVDMVIPVPGYGTKEFYIFSGSEYAAISYDPNGDSLNDKYLWGPHNVVTYWPSLHQAGFY